MVRLLIGLVILSQGAALVGDLLLAGVVDRNPALLIALNARNRNLAAATIQLDALTYYSIGFARLVISDPVYYLLGYWYGDKLLAWIRRRSRTYGPLVDDGQRYFRQAAYPLIFFLPNNIICALSAITGIRLRVFIALNVAGTVTRLYLIRIIGEEFRSPIQSVIDFIARYRFQFFIVSAILVAWTVYSEFFSGQDSEVQTIRHLADDEPADGDDPADGDGDAEAAAEEKPSDAE